ncbi:NUDIX domain-containing protein [Clostridiaceae bacterium M8S5]|nr:NUDIX domain-containing protein [Clostridiaceae bacterium M8S5]
MEVWDVLNKDGEVTGKTLIRDKEEFKEEEYHLVVHIWIVNRCGEILIQKRPEHLDFAPGVWAIAGGSALQGEDSITAARREVKEELGININPVNEPIRYRSKISFTDIWVVEKDIDLDDIKLQKDEVSDVKWVTIDKLKLMMQKGKFYRTTDDNYYKLLSKYIAIF